MGFKIWMKGLSVCCISGDIFSRKFSGIVIIVVIVNFSLIWFSE